MLDDMLKVFGIENPFDENGELTPEGEAVKNKAIEVILCAERMGLVKDTTKCGCLEDEIDEIVSLGF